MFPGVKSFHNTPVIAILEKILIAALPIDGVMCELRPGSSIFIPDLITNLLLTALLPEYACKSADARNFCWYVGLLLILICPELRA